MKNLQKFYINGKWVKPNSTKTMAVLNPATEDLIGEIIPVSYTHLTLPTILLV